MRIASILTVQCQFSHIGGLKGQDFGDSALNSTMSLATRASRPFVHSSASELSALSPKSLS